MEIMPYRPFGFAGRFRRDMDDLFRRFLSEMPGAEFEMGEWVPSADISETDGEIKVKAELPGLDAKDIDISIHGDVLTIKGEKRREEEKKEAGYYSSERYFGAFQRSFRLPAEVAGDKVGAVFKNGVLSVTLPKIEERKKKRIEIKSE